MQRTTIAIIVSLALCLPAAPAFAQPEHDALPAQAGTFLVHGLGEVAGLLLGGVIVFEAMCFYDRPCSDATENATWWVLGATTALVGAALGSLATWGFGRAIEERGEYLPTFAVSLAGHAVGGTMLAIWTRATDGDAFEAYAVSMFVGSALGTTGAIVGFRTSF